MSDGPPVRPGDMETTLQKLELTTTLEPRGPAGAIVLADVLEPEPGQQTQ